MDPDAALKAIREFIRTINKNPEENSDEALNLVQHFTALDDWMTNGGFPPHDWRPYAHRAWGEGYTACYKGVQRFRNPYSE